MIGSMLPTIMSEGGLPWTASEGGGGAGDSSSGINHAAEAMEALQLESMEEELLLGRAAAVAGHARLLETPAAKAGILRRFSANDLGGSGGARRSSGTADTDAAHTAQRPPMVPPANTTDAPDGEAQAAPQWGGTMDSLNLPGSLSGFTVSKPMVSNLLEGGMWGSALLPQQHALAFEGGGDGSSDGGRFVGGGADGGVDSIGYGSDDDSGMMKLMMEGGGEGRPSRHLWLGNIPLRPSKQAMEMLFSAFGPLESIRVFPGKTFAFVNFVNPLHAIFAKSTLDGQPAPSITGCKPLAIRFQRDTASVPAGMTHSSSSPTLAAAAAAAATMGGGLDPSATMTGPTSNNSSVTNLASLGGLAAVGTLTHMLDEDSSAPEPAINLSNRLNPNNVHFDKELAQRYKRMSKTEKEALWAQDRAFQQLTAGSMGMLGPSGDVIGSETHVDSSPSTPLFSASGTLLPSAVAASLQQQQQQRQRLINRVFSTGALDSLFAASQQKKHLMQHQLQHQPQQQQQPHQQWAGDGAELGRGMGPQGGMFRVQSHQGLQGMQRAAATAAAARQLMHEASRHISGPGVEPGGQGPLYPMSGMDPYQGALLQQQMGGPPNDNLMPQHGVGGMGMYQQQQLQQQQQRHQLQQQQVAQHQHQRQLLLAAQEAGGQHAVGSGGGAGHGWPQQQQQQQQGRGMSDAMGGLNLGAMAGGGGGGGMTSDAYHNLSLQKDLAVALLQARGDPSMGEPGVGGIWDAIGQAAPPHLGQMPPGGGLGNNSWEPQVKLPPSGSRTASWDRHQFQQQQQQQLHKLQVGSPPQHQQLNQQQQGRPGGPGASSLGPVPLSFLCPLSRVVMADPVMAADGVTYERAAIEAWMRGQRGETSPSSGQLLANR